jgi:hypothetical protein
MGSTLKGTSFSFARVRERGGARQEATHLRGRHRQRTRVLRFRHILQELVRTPTINAETAEFARASGYEIGSTTTMDTKDSKEKT